MDLAEALISIPQTERGGEIAQQGFDYQSCWALSEMLEYELKGNNYVFVFEYHDDIVILDNEVNPKKLIFAQVKTRDKHWTASNLYSTSKKKPVSIIGKLYQHKKKFSQYSPKLLFVTNATFGFHPKIGSKTYFKATSVEKSLQDKFVESILSQVDISEVDLYDLEFIQSSLSLEDHMVHLMGKLCKFLSDKYGSDYTLNANSLSVVLESTCREKSKFNSSSISSFEDLVDKKGFSSKAFNDIIDNINKNNQLKPTWDKAKSIFSSLGKDIIEMIKLESIFVQTCMDITKSTTHPCSVYLKYANTLYNQSKTEVVVSSSLQKIISNIDELCPDYSLALTAEKKECIIVYSIIKNLLEEGEK